MVSTATLMNQDHVGIVLSETRQAVGIFVSQKVASFTSQRSDSVEFFLAVAVALQLLWKIEDILRDFRTLANNELFQLKQGQLISDGDNYVGNWKLLAILNNLIGQFESVSIYLLVQFVTDLAVDSGHGNIDESSSTVIAIFVFVLVDAMAKLRWRSPNQPPTVSATADVIDRDIRAHKRYALLWSPVNA